MNLPSKRRRALIVTIVVALLVLLASFGDPLPPRPFSPVTLNDPSGASSNGSITAVVTDRARHLLLINESSELVAAIDYETFEAPLEIVTDVCVSNNRVYVAGFKRKRDSNSIACERLVAYGLDGRLQGIVYEIGGWGNVQRICSLDDAENGVILSILSPADEGEDETGGTLSFQKIDEKGVHEIDSVELASSAVMDASYSEKAHATATLSYRGVINDEDFYAITSVPDRLYSSICIADDASVFAYDFLSGELCHISAENSGVSAVADDVTYSGLDINGDIM